MVSVVKVGGDDHVQRVLRKLKQSKEVKICQTIPGAAHPISNEGDGKYFSIFTNPFFYSTTPILIKQMECIFNFHLRELKVVPRHLHQMQLASLGNPLLDKYHWILNKQTNSDEQDQTKDYICFSLWCVFK